MERKIIQIMNNLKIVCPCHFGLESVLKFEAKKIGAENITVNDGRVSFTGDFSTLVRANLWLSTAERVLIELGSFHATSFEELFQGVKALPFEDFIGKDDQFPVKGYSLDSTLHSVPDCQSIIKKAIVERLKQKYNISWFEENGNVYKIRFSLHKDIATIYLDSTGQGLHKRGYRAHSNNAPIKETLAAGITDLAYVKSDSIVCDPFCGSGTLLIEAAYKALNIAPGLKRRFTSENWGIINPQIWLDERANALASIKKDSDFFAYGYDIDPEAVALTQENCRKAGIQKRVKIAQADIGDFVNEPNTITICNPPYGERMLEIKEAEELYKIMGKRFLANAESSAYIIAPHEHFEELFGKKADKRRKLYNGMLKCQLFMYYR